MLEQLHRGHIGARTEEVPARGVLAVHPGGPAVPHSEHSAGQDPRHVPTLPGAPPRQTVRPENRSVILDPLPELPVEEPRFSRRAGSGNAGLVVSAVLHFCVLVGLTILAGPLHLGRDERVDLDVAVARNVPPPEVLELDDGFVEEFTAVRIDQATALPPETSMPWATPSRGGLLGGSGVSGPHGTFFGTVAQGNRFIYALDVSPSMNEIRDPKKRRTRLDCAIDELLYSVDRLTADQYFYVVLFSYETRPMFDEDTLLPQLIPATAENKRRLRAWLSDVGAGSGTDPRLALHMALQMHPSAVFLLSDGEFNGQRNRENRDLLHGNPSVEEVVSASNARGTPIHTLAFEDQRNRARMEALAVQTGGKHRYIPPLKLPNSK